MEPGGPQQGLPGFHDRLVDILELQEETPWQPAVTIATAARLLIYGADPNIALDEEDEVRAVAIGAALDVADRIDHNRRVDLANKIAHIMGGE